MLFELNLDLSEGNNEGCALCSFYVKEVPEIFNTFVRDICENNLLDEEPDSLFAIDLEILEDDTVIGTPKMTTIDEEVLDVLDFCKDKYPEYEKLCNVSKNEEIIRAYYVTLSGEALIIPYIFSEKEVKDIKDICEKYRFIN